mmetsp:Transcript_40341/g.61573  ORF Transcript_40341/g.61573 Transcript_40341/m.61573 type:complete len:86 (+) Transcript_40341:527-784(+)
MAANSSDNPAKQVSISQGFNMSEPEVATKNNTLSQGLADLQSTKEPSQNQNPERSLHSVQRHPVPPIVHEKDGSISTLITNVMES